MLSYAQNGEDVVLDRLFGHQLSGQYVDIGANHPIVDSVTKHFSLKGWTGVNVEPLPALHALLCEDRIMDTNLAAAVTDHAGRDSIFAFEGGNHGLSTLSRSTAQGHGILAREVSVETLTLEDLFVYHVRGQVDFLKVDVEGLEATVIRSGNWRAFRPRVVVVEATEPRTTVPSHGEWEPILLEAGYCCTLFDGLNRFYAQADDAAALACLSVPANVTDDYVSFAYASRLADLEFQVRILRQQQPPTAPQPPPPTSPQPDPLRPTASRPDPQLSGGPPAA